MYYYVLCIYYCNHFLNSVNLRSIICTDKSLTVPIVVLCVLVSLKDVLHVYVYVYMFLVYFKYYCRSKMLIFCRRPTLANDICQCVYVRMFINSTLSVVPSFWWQIGWMYACLYCAVNVSWINKWNRRSLAGLKDVLLHMCVSIYLSLTVL
jgi:hypothetical protein